MYVLATHLEDLVDATKLQVCNEPEVVTRKGSKGEQDSILDITLVSPRLETEVAEWGVYEEFSVQIATPGLKSGVTQEAESVGFPASCLAKI